MAFGVEVDDLEAVPDALRRHRLVIVRCGGFGLDEQVGLTARLGRLVGRAPGIPQVRYEEEDRHADHAFFNEQWHADLSWCAEGPTITVLYALAIGRRAAPTAFVDTISGFEGVPASLRDAASDWRAHHHVEHARLLRFGRSVAPRPRRRRGRPGPPPGHDATAPTYLDVPGIAHPVVETDEASGRRGVLLGDHAWTLVGFPETEGRALVDDVQAQVVGVGERYLHDWRPGDLLVYDNRSILHRREPMARPGRRRVLRRTVAWPGGAMSPVP